MTPDLDAPATDRKTDDSPRGVRRVVVHAASRLHFGLFAWGGAGRQFGGVGVMVRQPGLSLCAEQASAAMFEGPLASRIAEFCGRWADYRGLARPPALRWRVSEAPPEHVGLGTGTQLGLAVAAALFRLCGERTTTPQELALSVGRGLRSAIGAYGFSLGGLIVEPGKLAGEDLSPLGRRTSIPDAWRFVLVRPAIACGLHGPAERQAFAALPPVPIDVTQRLVDLATLRLAPAAERGDFTEFSSATYHYGILAGGCFTPVQGGPFNGAILASLVERIRALGVIGVGQSSWGPTLFAVLPDEANARQFARDLVAQTEVPLDITITAADNAGARIEVRGSEPANSP